MYCYELMKIPSFKDIKLVAGDNGLNKKVSWVYVLQTEALENWVYGGEILFIMNTSNLYQKIEDAVSHKISCAVVLKNENNESTLTEDIIHFANEENFPLFEMDYNIKIIDVTREISTYIVHKQEKSDYLDYFFHKILLSESLKAEEIEEFSLNYGFHNDHEFFIAAVQCSNIAKLNNVKTLFHIYIAEDNVRFLSTIMNGRLVFLAFASEKQLYHAKEILKNSFHIIHANFPDELSMGIGSCCHSLREVHHSYVKAVKALSLCSDNTRIIDYETLGFARLLLHMNDTQELIDYASHILGNIKEYDRANQTNFLTTIEAYVLHNGNINKVANYLHIHRNTCIYRISKIKELFEIDPENPYTRADILNALAIYHFLE